MTNPPTDQETPGEEAEELTAAEIVDRVINGTPEANDLINQATGH